MKTSPSAIYHHCPHCDEDVLHQVVKGRIGGTSEITFDGTVRCTQCNRTYHATFKTPGSKEVPVIISWQKESERRMLSLGMDEIINVGEIIQVGDLPVMVTAIDCGDKRPNEAKVSDIDTIWSKRFEKVKIKFSINKRGTTISRDSLASPDEEFTVGERMQIGRMNVVIHSIKTQDKKVRYGTVQAMDIQRIYCKLVRRQ